MEVSYFLYHIPMSDTNFIGTEKSQIIDTAIYYKNKRKIDIEIPNIEEILNIDRVDIMCSLPFAHVDHNIEAEIRKNVKLYVNENAIESVKNIGENYEQLKRGSLYKFIPGLRKFGVFLLPKYVIEGINEYDWDKHRFQLNRWKNESLNGP